MSYPFKTPAPHDRGIIDNGYPDAVENDRLKEWRDANDEDFWRRACKPTTVQLELDLVVGEDWDELYRDCSAQNGFVSASYTSCGLRARERWMVRQIRDGSIYPFVELEAMITHNVHYHWRVKENLLLNLNNYKSLWHESAVDTPTESE